VESTWSGLRVDGSNILTLEVCKNLHYYKQFCAFVIQHFPSIYSSIFTCFKELLILWIDVLCAKVYTYLKFAPIVAKCTEVFKDRTGG